jgi:hypothetical protein
MTFGNWLFPDACARTWWEIGGGKKHHALSDGAFSDARGRGGVLIFFEEKSKED